MTYQVVIRIRVVLILFSLIGCNEKKLKIIPLSPYEGDTYYVVEEKTKEFYFAIENFSFNKKKKAEIDSFVLQHLPKQKLKQNEGMEFLFYKYKRGKIDENFKYQESPKQNNLSMGESEAQLLIEYIWHDGRFFMVYYHIDNENVSERRNW
jgi:hypothetical protein